MKRLSIAVLIVYLLILLWLILFKFSFDLFAAFDYPVRVLNLTPFAYVSFVNLRETLYNFVVFIPFGLFLSISLKQMSLWQRLAIIFTFSLTAEVIQLIFGIGRTDITDVITNTFGGLMGILFYDFSSRNIDPQKLDKFIIIAGTILLLILIALLGLLFTSDIRLQLGR